jgi:tetratricopeptide (TPR) repeat protein
MMATFMSVMNDPPHKLRSVNSEIHPDLELICLKCLEKDPNNRYASASEFASDLRAFQRCEPLHVRAPSLLELARMWLAGNYGNVVWVPIIAMVVGIGSGAGIWIMAFGGRSANLENVYANFARDDQPLWAFFWITQELIQYVAVPILFLATIAIGWATARLVKPKNAAADWGVGLAVGLLSGLLAFMCGAGAPLIDSQLEPGDMNLLFKLAANPGSPSATNELLERYPSLSSQTPYNRAVLLYNKTTYGLRSGMTVGIWNGALFCLFWFGISGAIQTWVAGPLVRNQSRVSGFFSYLCFAFAWVAIVFIVFGEGWITLVVGAGMILDWAAPIACVIFALLTMYTVITNRGWPIKAATTLAWAGLFILFFMQTYASTDNILHSVANTRAEIAKAEQLVDREPSSRNLNLKLAQAYFNFAIALHERGRFEWAIEEHEKALNQLMKFGPPQDLSDSERALYSSILYWSSVDAFETDDAKTAADRMLQHIQFFPYSSRFVLKLYAQSVLALGDSIEVADYITPAAKDSPDQWRVTINLINALTQVGQSPDTHEDQQVDDRWRSRVVDEMLDRATGNVDDEVWALRRKQLRQWMLSQQSWKLYGPLDIPVDADQQKALASPTEIEEELLSRSGTAEPTSTYSALPQTQVDFTKLFDRTEHAIAYATGDFELKEPQEVTFRLGADDLHELWIDEELVHQNVGIVGIAEGRQQFTHTLDQGKHSVMIKVTQGIGEWGFVIDAADSDGWPLPIWENTDVSDSRHGN